MIEAITAITLLAATTAGLVKLAQIHSAIHRADIRDLAARTMATNTVERLRQNRAPSIRELQDQVNQVRTPFNVQIEEQAVETDAVTGSHFVVSVHESKPVHPRVKPLAQEHFWRLEPTDSSSEPGSAP